MKWVRGRPVGPGSDTVPRIVRRDARFLWLRRCRISREKRAGLWWGRSRGAFVKHWFTEVGWLGIVGGYNCGCNLRLSEVRSGSHTSEPPPNPDRRADLGSTSSSLSRNGYGAVDVTKSCKLIGFPLASTKNIGRTSDNLKLQPHKL